jgi:FlaA1/EpsC-like NDP-sugar epimerase
MQRHAKKQNETGWKLWRFLPMLGYWPVLIHDLLIGVLAFCLALSLRLGFEESVPIILRNWLAALLFGAILSVCSLLLGMTRAVWRYASISDAVRLLGATLLAVLVWTGIAFLTFRLEGIPRTAPLIMVMVTLLGLLMPRMSYRYYRENRHALPLRNQSAGQRMRVIIVGLDRASLAFAAAARYDGSRFEIAAILEWNHRREGRRIHGAPVFSFDGLDFSTFLETIGADERPIGYMLVYPPTSGLSQHTLDALIEASTQHGIPIRRVHELSEMKLSDERRLHTPDILQLLGRRENLADAAGDTGFFEGKRILVTGAGGSIGGELCRQIAMRRPAAIATLEASELNLVTIGRQLAVLSPDTAVVPMLCDVRDRERLHRAIASFAPDAIYHAAALKHVPVTESFADEAVLTNVGGTVNVVDIAEALGVPFVLNISTDKAVQPVNILGYTKRAGELYLQSKDRQGPTSGEHRTRFLSVRFGNVVDSSGSVVPLFREQIARGGPVTVTDPEIERFCMSVSEAVSLVLSAHTVIQERKDERGGIVVLDMGRSIKIDKLARQMIRLAGLRPDEDIRIEYIGLRPGEKMHEELFSDSERPVRSSSDRLFYVSAPDRDDAVIEGRINTLLKRLATLGATDIRAALAEIEAPAPPRKSGHIQLVK